MREPATPAPIAVSHIVLDVDGTLVNYVEALRVAVTAVAEQLSEVLDTVVTPRQLHSAREHIGAEPAWRDRGPRAVREESIRRVLLEGGVPDEDVLGRVSETFYRTRDEVMRPYDDVEETLATLYERGFTLIAGSNGNVVLEQQPFARYLVAIHLAEEVGVSKPDPRFFRSALDRVEGSPGTALSVGDRIENDYEAARRAGLQAILLDRHGHVDDPSITRIATLRALPAMLERA